MRDYLTVLMHSSLVLAKQWQADGTIKGYDKPKYFAVREAEVKGIEELSALLTELESDRRSCVIRGKLKGESSVKFHRKGKIQRTKANFKDAPHHWIMIEVDKFQPVICDPVVEPEIACREYIECCLPVNFHRRSFHWQLSGSAGHASKAGFLKAHIWFWLSEARNSLSLREWAEDEGIECDKAVFDEIQVHYTAAPVIGRDVKDPVPRRSGLWRGERDEVIVDIPISEASGGKDRLAGNWQGAEDEFSLALEEKGKVKGRGRDGSVYIECPWIAGHSMKGGDNETVYWPAGTGGYELGHFDCRHDSCRGREDGDFVWALGLMDDEFEDLGEIKKVAESMDPPQTAILRGPSYVRTQNNGEPLAIIDNLRRALERPDECGIRIGFDNFKFQVMVAETNDSAWRRITDVDYTKIQCRLEREKRFKPIGYETLRRAVELVAHANQFDSAQEWLAGLVWDGVSRVSDFMPRYFGTENSAYSRAVGEYLWTALAGRIIEPGVKADMVPILKSEEGYGKSTSIASIAPLPEMFTEINFDEPDNDLSRRMRGKLIGEIPELQALTHKKEIEWVNMFITRTHEEWTPKYSNNVVSFARRLVFIASTNNTELLPPDGAQRRWLPIAVKPADVAALRCDRDQLWAEGRELFGLFGVMFQDAERLAGVERGNYRIEDTWEEVITEWLHRNELDGKPVNREFFTTLNIAREALQLPNTNLKGNEGKRISTIMRKNGYIQVRIGRENYCKRVWKLP